MEIPLRMDPIYEKISRRFLANPDQLADSFARAWFKLTHRDMGPRSRYLGPEVPKEVLIWQDPVPDVDHPLINNEDVATLKAKVLASGLTASQLVGTAWASASTFRGGDKRGGANGARIRLAPAKDWEVNQPAQLAKVLKVLEGIQTEFNKSATGGNDVPVPFTPGRTDASQEQTEVAAYNALEPLADGFRNYRKAGVTVPAGVGLIDKAQLLTLTAPEMTVLLGGLRAININADGCKHGIFTDKPGVLTNDFFVKLLGMDTQWKPVSDARESFEGYDRKTGKLKWTGTRVDLVFGSS